MFEAAKSAIKFAEAVRRQVGYDLHSTYTENGAYALNSSLDPVLDLFSLIGSMRKRSIEDIIDLVEKSYSADPLLTTKIIFFARDIRGGLGERRVFRRAINYLANKHPEAVINNIYLFPVYGRYDDLYCLMDTPVESHMWDSIKEVWNDDIKRMARGDGTSLLAKWLKTPDTSSRESRKLARITANKLGYSIIGEYTKMLRKLRAHIKVTEVAMTKREWETIDYEKVPSRAAMIYRSAFARHDSTRYNAYIEAVNQGKAVIHSDTLYPYDICEKVMRECRESESLKTLEAQWRALPNYIVEDCNALVMADTSGSMYGRPLSTALSLALYFAERNKGAFHNIFMTFSRRPAFVAVEGKTLWEKFDNMEQADWDGNTNIEAAFDRILELAVSENCKQEEMPKSLIIISDMEFDMAMSSSSNLNLYYDTMRRKFADAGYTLPNVVFWNVNARHNTFHAAAGTKGVQLLSGSSASSFKSLIGAVGMTPEEYMMSVINNDRYSPITIRET